MRVARIVPIALIVLATGCTSNQLRISTVNQAGTLSDIQYKMVMENLPLLAASPGALPWHVNINSGAAQVADTGQGLFSGGVNAYQVPRNGFTSILPAAQAARTVVQQWSLDPVTDGDELKLLRIAYRRACGSPEMPDPKLLDDLAHDLKKVIVNTEDLRTESLLFYQDMFFHQKKSFQNLARDTDSTVGDQKFYDPDSPGPDPRKTPLAREVAHEVNDIVDELKSIAPGWYGVGCRKDVPKDARYVAHNGDVYVWVCPSGVEGLTRFTLSILEISSALSPPTSVQTNGVNYSPGFDTSF